MYSARELAIARQIKPDIELAQLDATDLAVLQLVRKATGGGSGVYNATIENGIAYFDRVSTSQPLVSLKLNLPVTQQGSGTPAPDNKRDFIGVSGVNIGQISNEQYASAFKGLLAGTHGFVDLGDLTWTKNDTTYSFTYFLGSTVSGMKIGLFDDKYSCSAYAIHDGGRASLTDDHIGSYSSGQARPVVRDDSKSNLTAEEFKSAMSGIYLIYELAEPSTPITPQEYATLCQVFGITGITYTISFGQTVYSANLDVLTGILSLTHQLKTIDENSDVSMSSTGTGIFYLDDFFEIDEDTESINSNLYQRAENRSSVTGVINNNPDYSFCCKLGTNPTRIFIKDTRFTTLEDYTTWLSTNPVKIAVKLATPIEVQLTPTQITTLIGENVIFADVADVTECKYTRK